MKKNKAKLFDFKHFFMDFGRIVCCSMPLWFRLKKLFVSEKAKEKIKGGAILVSNHTNFLDPLMVGNAVWYRRVFFLAAEVVMQRKFVNVLLKGIGCIEINRNICDMNAIRKAVSILKEGHVLTVFPQGGIDREDNVESIKSGVILMAMQAKVPIIPMYTFKKNKDVKRNVVVFGEPITTHLPENGKMLSLSEIEAAAGTVLEKMTECKMLFEKIYGGDNHDNG